MIEEKSMPSTTKQFIRCSWRGHQQSRLTMAFAARLGHHLAVKQAEQHRLSSTF